MKSILIFIFCTALNISSFASSNTAKLNEAASALYTEGKYAEALGIWYGLAASGNTDANLFFDIGNAESILGHIPEAILAYERAAKWRPGDRTIQEAIKKERVKIENAVIPVNSFFLIDWYDNIMAMFRPGEWVWLALLLLGMGIMQWLVKMEAIRKIGWINGRNPLYFIGTGMLLLIIGVLSYNQLHRIDEAIVMNICESRQAASAESPVSRILYPGEKVRITDQISGWKKVSLLNLDEGWMNVDCLTSIDPEM